MSTLSFTTEATAWDVWAVHRGIEVHQTRWHPFGTIHEVQADSFNARCTECYTTLGTTYRSRNGAREALKRHYRKVHAEAVRP